MVDKGTARDLHVLKQAWKLPTLDAVIARMIASNRPAMIGALGVEIRMPGEVSNDGQPSE